MGIFRLLSSLIKRQHAISATSATTSKLTEPYKSKLFIESGPDLQSSLYL